MRKRDPTNQHEQSAAAVNKTLTTHPLICGATANVFQIGLSNPPSIEGRARILRAVPEIADCYDIQFMNERRTVRRLVHAGAWQSAPESILSALIGHWRLTIAPELLFPASPFGGSPHSRNR